MSEQTALSVTPSPKDPSPPWEKALFLCNLCPQFSDYVIDAWQRQILFLDILRQRGNQFLEEQGKPMPNILFFDSVLLIDGRELLHPVNYLLCRVVPTDGKPMDPTKRPLAIFDPRAGHGPGMSGMKSQSEIGVALQQGHPVYCISFLPEPVPGQTVEDVCLAEAHFVRQIIQWHPHADKPCLIGNCQAGWQIAMMSAMDPELSGLLILAGAPLSFWTGQHGENHMRYTSGMTGGAWLVSMMCDLGAGLYDGAHLVNSFEINNPAHAYWRKLYDVYAKADTEGTRFLAFEKWWNNPIFLSREEIQFVTDDLFIGNHLSTGQLHTSSGIRIDLRNIKAPIVIFCSHGDDITSPQQALGWLLDIYACDDDILANDQTIVYALHNHIGHLGIFVSGATADKEHQKLISNTDMIEMLPPGLYEALFIPKTDGEPNAALASGQYILSFKKRSLDDIRALGVNAPEDDLRFETVARLSENLRGLYDTFVAPFLQAVVTPEVAKTIRTLHPLRQQVAFFSDANPLFSVLPVVTEGVTRSRKNLSADNVFWAAQEAWVDFVESSLETLNNQKNSAVEALFLSLYSHPFLQACVGLRTSRPYAKPTISRDLQMERERQARLAALTSRMEQGGMPEALVRSLLHISRAHGSVDEREYRLLMHLREGSSLFGTFSLEDFKALARQQYMLLILDEELALRALPKLIGKDGPARQIMELIREVISASAPPSPEEERRLQTLADLFDLAS